MMGRTGKSVKVSNPNSEVAFLSYLPEWFLIEILTRLPLKPVFRFKCVSKQWLSLISDPCFVRLYITHNQQQPCPWTLVRKTMQVEGSVIGVPCPPEYELPQSINSDRKSPTCSVLTFPRQQLVECPAGSGADCRILASSNGLILCHQRILSDAYFYKICNPVTRQWVALPPPIRAFKMVCVGFIAKVEGGVATSYKVVRLDCSVGGGRSGSNVLNLEIFSSETGEWRGSTVHCPLNLNLAWWGEAVVCNDILHWFDCRHGIVAYDPYSNTDNTDGCRLIELPENKKVLYYGTTELCDVFQGHLRYFEMTGLCPGLLTFTSFRVWTLTDYETGGWCLEHRVVHTDILFDASLTNALPRPTLFPLAFDPCEKEIVYLGYNGLIVSYNMQTRMMELHSHPFSMFGSLSLWVVISHVIPPWPTMVPQPSWKVTDSMFGSFQKKKKRKVKREKKGTEFLSI